MLFADQHVCRKSRHPNYCSNGPDTDVNSMKTSFRILLIVLLGCVTSGCGGDSLVLVDVEGTVLFDDAPLVDAEVIFQPQDGRPSFARTDENGHFVLQYTDEKMGAVPGEHQVRISGYIEKDGDSSNPLRQEGREEFIPECYNVKSKLTAKLETSGTQVVDFRLTTSGQ